MENRDYRKAVTFSYDDGVTQDKRLIQLFQRYGMGATFNLNTGIQARESSFMIQGKAVHRMDQDGLKELYGGYEIAIHGLTHTSLAELKEEALLRELQQDAENIEKLYGSYPVGMAYAYGDYSDEAIACLKRLGIQYARTVESSYSFSLPEDPLQLRPTCHHNDERIFALVEEFLGKKPDREERMLLYIWGHSYEFDVQDNWERMEKLCQLLSGRDDIFYGTNAQCLEMFGCIS